MTGILTPILGLIGIIAAAALGAFGKEWFSDRRAKRRAESPVGQAEAKAITLAINLDREKWLDEQTRSLFDTVHEQLDRALAEIAALRLQVKELSAVVHRAELRVLDAERQKATAEAERDEMRDLIDVIKRGKI